MAAFEFESQLLQDYLGVQGGLVMGDKVIGELEPVDTTQCQAEKKVGSFMSFGIPSLQRCKNDCTWLAVGVENGLFAGAMTLCDECKKVCEIQRPDVSFQRLVVKGVK